MRWVMDIGMEKYAETLRPMTGKVGWLTIYPYLFSEKEAIEEAVMA